MIDGVTAMIEYIQSHIVSLMFAALFLSFILYVIRLHRSNGVYQNFRLAGMIMRGDGSIDRKAMKDTALFLMTMYGFLHVMHKQPDMLISYFWAMMVAWGVYHVADKKLPDLGIPKKSTQPTAGVEP